MAIFEIQDVIAVHDSSKLYCIDCFDLDNTEEVTIYTESGPNEEEILQCDECNKII